MMEIKTKMESYNPNKIIKKKESDNHQIYFLKWNDFERQLLLSFANLFATKEFADCTLICDGVAVEAHKIVLSMCSPYFRQLLKEHTHPTVIIDGITSTNLGHVLEFIYMGTVSLKESQIQEFIETAEFLCVDGIECPNSSPPPSPPTDPPPSSIPAQQPIISEGALNLKRRSPSKSVPGQMPSNVSPPPPKTMSTGQSFIEEVPPKSLSQVVPTNFISTFSNAAAAPPPPPTSTSQLPSQLPLTVNNNNSTSNNNNAASNTTPTTTSSTTTSTSVSIPTSPVQSSSKNVIQNSCDPRVIQTNPSNTVQSQPLNLAKRRIGRSPRQPTSLLKHPLVIVEDHSNSNPQQQQQQQQKGNQKVGPVSSSTTTTRVSNSSSSLPGEYQLSIKTVEPNIQLFTTPSGMIVTTAYGLKPTTTTTNWPGLQQQQQHSLLSHDENSVESSMSGSLILPGSSSSPNPSSSVLEYSRSCSSSNCGCSNSSCGSSSQFRSHEEDSILGQSLSFIRDHQYLIPTSSSSIAESRSGLMNGVTSLPASHQMALLAANRLKCGKMMIPSSSGILTDSRWTTAGGGGGRASPGSAFAVLPGKTGSASIPQPLKYTAAQVRALVDSVTNVSGPFVPCKLCEKVVKRERLRAHIYECHLVNGQKITCPYCGVGLKSKGSYRVHVWRHRKGSLKGSMKNNTAYNNNNNNKTKIRNV